MGLIVGIIVLGVFSAPLWASSAAEALYAQGKAESFMFKKLAAYNEAIDMDSNLVEARKDRAFILYYQGKYHQALEDLTACIEKGLDVSEVRAMRGKVFIALNNYKEAQEDLSRVIEENGQDRDARLDRALASVKLKEYDKALADLKILLREDHRDKVSNQAYRLMGEILLAKGENEAAREYFARSGGWYNVMGINFPVGMYNARAMSVIGMIGLIVSCAALIFRVDLPAPKKSKRKQ